MVVFLPQSHVNLDISERRKINQSPSLVDTYNMLFKAIRADTPALMAEAYKLRYQVYCVENSFLDPNDNPGELETDRYDEHSLQSLLVHRLSSQVVGTTRLVLPKLGATAGNLPFFELCPEAVRLLPVETTAEFSRFAVSRVFRRRAGDELYGRAYDSNELIHDGRRAIPHITLGLMAVALQMGREYGINHVCAVMEPALLRLLARFGIRFRTIGPLIEHHGLRQPCYADVSELLAQVETERFDVWEVITDRGRFWPAAHLQNAELVRV